MTSHRLRWGALVWLLTLQFFVVETIVQFRGEGHSRIHDVISDLGATTWPWHQLMNASFVVQAALVVGGALLLAPVLGSGAGVVARWLFGAAAVGLLLLAVFPSDASGAAHGTGAVFYLIGSALGLIALAYAVRPRSELLGTLLVVLGLVGASATTFFLTGVEVLAEGATERAATYALPIGLAVAALGLWRLGPGEPAATGEAGMSLREERAQERARAAERARERDAALEAAARRGEDPEDPWATGPRDS
ncbi:DUF998 domain-containing protein [Blastococcus sp. CCUG 61487]|uniref:DUF998 domain-containing protein n=1 Tax=Blastococcus sp. CCUG 61487 TaxID=1840703 RepID=UPI0010C023E6|nr:DUF998 domain-containing protein [Blastococcus sp. CCUG 61487]TKJ19749.1 hypothetical protein A6V29_09880 [Blastococcus sp. CCUG 61487]